jgi:hypothetical protein
VAMTAAYTTAASAIPEPHVRSGSASSPARHWSAWRSARWWPVCSRTRASDRCSSWTARCS